MCSFYAREGPEWPVKEDVVLRQHRVKFAIRYELSVTPERQKSPVSESEAGPGTGHTASKQLELEVAASTFTPATKGLNINPLRGSEELYIVPECTNRLQSSLSCCAVRSRYHCEP